jgi:hypothetical protein
MGEDLSGVWNFFAWAANRMVKRVVLSGSFFNHLG